ncbi:hypothetical protein SAY86_018075 [Trapa natans]|uniref:Uncharacterized protein n=1 Tax=Trapa natans TaxID=22666 RepID=A0AAN7QYG3_TRANT|nr:hypothetical protein SAY86_018075 [Trapa natans]
MVEVDRLQIQGRLLARSADYDAAAKVLKFLIMMLGSHLWTELNKLLMDSLKFMADQFIESAGLTFVAYHGRNYSKVIEVVQLKERIETAILNLRQNAGSLANEEISRWIRKPWEIYTSNGALKQALGNPSTHPMEH